MKPSLASLIYSFYLLVNLQPTGSKRIEVRVWHQPQIDTSKIKEPVRFWELVEWRPVSEEPTTTPITTTTTPSTTTTTSTAATTVRWEPPTTIKQCDDSDPEVLVRRMKDSGVYNEIYMAPDFLTASQKFPNLAGRQFMSPKAKYKCDQHCERSASLVRLVMTGDDVQPMPEDPPRTWWDQSKWDRTQPRKKRSILEPNEKPSRRRILENKIRSAMRELEMLDKEEIEEYNEDVRDAEKKREDSSFESFFAGSLDSNRRNRRSLNERNILLENSGTSRSVLGTTIAIECQDKTSTHDKSKTGYHFCSTCRAVRHLPREYFPRIVNEVICGDSQCVKGDGRCAQRFLPFKVLHNTGTDACPKWILTSIDIRTCCDCVVHPYSPFVRYLENR